MNRWADQLPVGVVKKIAQQTALALEFLHDYCGLVHTDLTADKVLVKLPGRLVVG